MRSKLLFLLTLVGFTQFSCKENPDQLFTPIAATHSQVDFSNEIEEDDTHNMFNFMNVYTGGGVGIGDFNNDGLPDLFFSGNIVSNKLYLNKGDFVFEDITKSAGLENSSWCTGVNIIDINQDGWSDIYVNVSGSDVPKNRANLLYINNKDNTFTEQAQAYGIADTSQVTQSAFFDYDLDGDLDLFLIINPVNYTMSNVNSVRPKLLDGQAPSTDRLYRNNGDGTFTDVSYESGIRIEGYSLGLGISDLNNDGWPDVYISNDFLTNDVMYINNGDGTFADQSQEQLKHTSFAGMGNDISDVNNDGKTDIVVLDMLPEENKRLKNLIPSVSYDKFNMLKRKGYKEQYTRNTLQINNGNNSFSEISYLAGISSTDWSWSVLLADYDNNGTRDIFITNGFRRDVGNLDYINYQQQSSTFFGTETAKKESKIKEIKELPSAAIPNYFFKNNGDLTFTNTSKEWAAVEPSLSNGAAYVDLDNDGDLDLVINNINEKASILKNNIDRTENKHYLKLRLKGSDKNQDGIGAKISLFTKGASQYYEHFLTRGYASSIDHNIHFGLAKFPAIDSLKITWPDRKIQILRHIKSDTLLVLDYKNAKTSTDTATPQSPQLFADIAEEMGIAVEHKENNYIDFNKQPLLPHMHSRLGPKLAVGDINGDNLEDFYMGGSKGHSGLFFLQEQDGSFTQRPLGSEIANEDTGALFFDADSDGDLDLYVVSGGSEFPKNDSLYQDRLYTNDGLGNFELSPDALPQITTSGGPVATGDYDADGDLDIFVGGRLVPGEYPMPAKSFILRNDNGTFTDVTPSMCAPLQEAGMVTAALWTDTDKDSRLDLVITGEFMPIRIFKNKGTTFSEETENAGLAESYGWWNSLAQGDFDNDGDIDYIAGNLGLNSKYKASVKEPLCIYTNDYDKNGTLDPVMCYYIKGKNYPAPPRDAIIGQIPAMKGRFTTFESYSNVTFEEAFLPEEIENAYVVKSQTFESAYIENLGKGRFKLSALPIEAQLAPVQTIQVTDIDADGNLDVLLAGNDYSYDASVGNHDASIGLSLMGDGKGTFTPIKGNISGFFVDDDARDIEIITGASGRPILLVSSNSSTLKAFVKKN
ncbi:VCBS repeat-containing protein [Zobellia uliginosa]|uniref:VCBS repeat-containing protein n=1 Tax=Zobellia uliginosa TaxID=143224 RepID=UPI0026E13454|nr:VCBS repeat-containing protein [Zobellia uliginosa]MDO6519553.1 VCBS repeat-containing protein [Zobellia uliginosa]